MHRNQGTSSSRDSTVTAPWFTVILVEAAAAVSLELCVKSRHECVEIWAEVEKEDWGSSESFDKVLSLEILWNLEEEESA